MTIKEQIRAEAVIREVARRNGVTPEQCRKDIQECIDATWASADPAVKEKQQQLFPNGKPSVETFLLRVTEAVKGQ